MAGRIGLCWIATSLVLWDIVQAQPATITTRTFVKSMTSPDASRTYTGNGLTQRGTASITNFRTKGDGFHIHCAQKCLSKDSCKGFDVMTSQNGDSFCKMYKECEADWESFGSHCYRLEKTISKGWTDAEQVCNEKGGHLVSVTSAEENDFIVKLHQTDFLAHFSNLWIGLDMAQAQPQWADGVDYGYSKFGTPIGTGQGDCVELNQNGEWERENCTSGRFFICEKH